MTNGLLNRNILVVDVSQQSLEDVQTILSVIPATVVTIQLPPGSNRCQETAARISDADLLICDLQLSQALEIGRCRGGLVFLSPFQKSDVAFKRLEQGSFYCLSKPVCPEVLLLIAEIVLGADQPETRRKSPLFPAHAGIPVSGSIPNALPTLWPTTGPRGF